MAENREPYYQRLGRRIRQAREDAGLTQAGLAELLDPPLTRAAIANIESGKQRVLLHTFEQISRALRSHAHLPSLYTLLTGREHWSIRALRKEAKRRA